MFKIAWIVMLILVVAAPLISCDCQYDPTYEHRLWSLLSPLFVVLWLAARLIKMDRRATNRCKIRDGSQ